MNPSTSLLCEPLKMTTACTPLVARSSDLIGLKASFLTKADFVPPKAIDVAPSPILSQRVPNVPQSCNARFQLPDDFQPKPYHVILGRGKASKHAEGNKRLNVIVTSFLPRYKLCKSKMEKTEIVSEIVQAVEDSCPPSSVHDGAFIKLINGRWWKVDGHAAREKVGYCIRDLLHERYSSSSKSKVARRRVQRNENKSSKDSASGTMSSPTEMEEGMQFGFEPTDSSRPCDFNAMVAAMVTPPTTCTNRSNEVPRIINEPFLTNDAPFHWTNLLPSMECNKIVDTCVPSTPRSSILDSRVDLKNKLYSRKVVSLEKAFTMYEPKMQRHCGGAFWDVEDEREELVDLPEDLSSIFDVY